LVLFVKKKLGTVKTSTLFPEDKDYRSQLSPPNFNEFLEAEWKAKKNSDIHYYSKISDFFKRNFPNIKIASEVERDLLIEELADVPAFCILT
jgi:hypothetical protein